jgi:hypothetical protein
MDDVTNKELLKYLAVQLASITISLRTITHLLEQDRPGYLTRHENGFEILWDEYRRATIQHEYDCLAHPSHSLVAADMAAIKD